MTVKYSPRQQYPPTAPPSGPPTGPPTCPSEGPGSQQFAPPEPPEE